MIAYFILVHRYPHQFKRLFTSIYHPKNQYLIHIDKKASRELFREIKLFISKFSNAHILTSQNVVWGGYSMVDVELRGMKKLLRINKKWDFFVNLSGQDFPLQTQKSIHQFLKKKLGNSFLKIEDQRVDRPNTLNRINNYFKETATGFLGKPMKRTYLSDTTPYIGGQWKILSRDCCEFICSSPKVAKFRTFYKNTLIADESFFQTVLMNAGYSGKLVNDDKRAIIWIPDIALKLRKKKLTIKTTKELVASGKIKLRPQVFTTKDLPFLISSQALFARKFDETVDELIFDVLESNLHMFDQNSVKELPTVLLNENIGQLFPLLEVSSPSLNQI